MIDTTTKLKIQSEEQLLRSVIDTSNTLTKVFNIENIPRLLNKNKYSSDKEEMKETDVAVTCPYCMQCVTGPPHIMKAVNGII